MSIKRCKVFIDYIQSNEAMSFIQEEIKKYAQDGISNEEMSQIMRDLFEKISRTTW